MSENNNRCSECFHTERFNGKYCSECGYFLNYQENSIKSQKLRQFIGKNLTSILVGSGFILLIWMFFLPAPYSLRYLFKRVFYQPTAVCQDGIYSFSSTNSGSCSGHGGVQNWIRN